MEPSLQKYAEILSSVDMQGVRVVGITSTVCAIFRRDDFSAKAERDGSFRYIDRDEVETWVISQTYNIVSTKLLSINVSRATGECSANVKSVTL